MPLTAKGEKILSNLEKEYGTDHGKQVLYAGKNKGTFTGIDSNKEPEVRTGEKEPAPRLDSDKVYRLMDGVSQLAARFDAMCTKRDSARK